MGKTFWLTLILAAVVLMHGAAFSASMVQRKATHIQPDNSKVDVLVSGDEYYHIIESPEGYTLIKDPHSGWLCYAKVSPEKTTYLSTGERYRGARTLLLTPLEKHLRISEPARNELYQTKRQKARYQRSDIAPDDLSARKPLAKTATDTMRITGLTILVKFRDVPVPANKTKQALDDLINKVGYDDGNFISVRDYFFAASNGKLIYTNIVTGFFTSDSSYKYLDGTTWDSGPVEAWIIRLLKQLEATGFDFTRLTQNTPVGGTVAFNVWYAADWGDEGLWPYQSSMRWTSKSGVSFRRFTLSNIGTETAFTSNTVFLHENGHLLFDWGDLYNSNIEHECLMGNSATKPGPPLPNPYYRLKQGWEIPANITGDVAGTTYALAVNSNASFRFDNTSTPTSQFYLFNGLQGNGHYRLLDVSGMHIWSVNLSKTRDLQVAIRVLNLKQNNNLWTFAPPVSNWPSGSTAQAPDLTNITQSSTHLSFMKKGTLVETVPDILSHPVNATGKMGTSVTFSVTATGGKLLYQWQKNGVNLSGATGSSYTTPAIDSSYLAFTYRCIVRNSLGSDTSTGATIAISTGPRLSLDKSTYSSGEQLIVTYSGFANSGTDWVGLYKKGVTQLTSTVLKWAYISGTSGTSTFTVNLPDGDYFAAGFENDSYAEASPRAPFTISSTVSTASAADAADHFPVAVTSHQFTRTLHLAYRLGKSSQVHAELYDIKGNRLLTIINRRENAGGHTLQADMRALTGGVYIVRFRVDHRPGVITVHHSP